jgi:hypothetical protein
MAPHRPASPDQKAAVRDKSKFQSNILLWPVIRSSRTFRVYVVEPKEYRPEVHNNIFDAAINALVTPERTRIDPYATDFASSRDDLFDLITFPEAFLPQDELLSALRVISSLDSIGCVHVGLRPTKAPDQHLFSVQGIRDLVNSLSGTPRIKTSDLDAFSHWLCEQSDEKKFNIGCLFTIDTDHQLRVCLHPKLVRSKFEVSPLHENHMAEADLLTLVTLLPADKVFFSVTLQPLLCSDALHLDTDRPQCWPLEGVNTDASCFGDAPPDHVDIVSVATCTPQQDQVTLKGEQYRTWHQEYLNSFTRAASELPRHRYSTFVLSNFQTIPGPAAGGLSGAFIPVPLPRAGFPSFVTTSSWGRFPGSGNRWSTPDDCAATGKGWSSLGYIASLDSVAIGGLAAAYMLGFTVHRLPRDTTRWRPPEGLVDFQLRRAMDDPESGRMVFRKQEV